MKKELKDYLPLYVGCQLWEEGNNQGELLGFVNFGGIWNVHTNCSSNEPYWSNISLHKLILRPLSDMTEDEAGWIWQYSFEIGLTTQLGNTFDYDISKIVDNEDNKKVVSINIHRTDRPDHCVNVRTCDGGTIVFNDSLENKKPEFLWRPAHSSVLFAYFLSKYFDLFGLIESGLAIDKTTLEQPLKQ